MPHERPVILVEVVYALPGRAIVKTFRLATPARVADALRAAAADPEFAAIDLTHAAVGIYGKLASPEQPLGPLDRIEIYRPLPIDPKEARRARAQRGRKKGAL